MAGGGAGGGAAMLRILIPMHSNFNSHAFWKFDKQKPKYHDTFKPVSALKPETKTRQSWTPFPNFHIHYSWIFLYWKGWYLSPEIKGSKQPLFKKQFEEFSEFWSHWLQDSWFCLPQPLTAENHIAREKESNGFPTAFLQSSLLLLCCLFVCL